MFVLFAIIKNNYLLVSIDANMLIWQVTKKKTCWKGYIVF
jgi:hypothetical protein